MSYKGKKNGSNVYNSAEGYDMYAKQYEKDYKLLRCFEKDRLFAFVGDLKGKKVLDLGCGTGRLIGELKVFGADVKACDVSGEMVKIAQEKYPALDIVKADALNLPYEDGTFDFVLATFLLVHIRDLSKLFGEVYRVLGSDGKFVLTNINQKKAPKLKLKNGEEIVINSFYHSPEKVLKELDHQFFKIEQDAYVEEKGTWINQIIRARKF
ncbi:MAG: class I SAM-dependent methyltransferase [bacterium]|nr:class I SAM-dependent methyltransferase [bacterium]